MMLIMFSEIDFKKIAKTLIFYFNNIFLLISYAESWEFFNNSQRVLRRIRFLIKFPFVSFHI